MRSSQVPRYARAVVALSLALVALALPAAAQPPLRARVDRPAPAPGDTVTVSVRVGSASVPVTGLLGVGFQLRFDPAVFDYVGYTRGALFADALASGNALEFGPRRVRPSDDLDRDGTPDGQSYVAYSVARAGSTGGVSGRGEVVVLRLRVRADAPAGRYALTLTEVDATREPDGAPLALRPVAAAVDRSPTRRALVVAFGPADAAATTFAALGGLRLDPPALPYATEFVLRRIDESTAGTPLADGYRMATGSLWSSETDEPAPAAEVCLPAADLPENLRTPDDLRVAARANDAGAWVILASRVVEVDGAVTHVCADAAPQAPFAPVTFALGTTGGVLPVELTAFTARADGSTVALAWTTEGETRNAGFALEVSGPSEEVREEPSSRTSSKGPRRFAWREAGFVPGAGTTAERADYAFAVPALGPGRYAFRLRQVDFDGTPAYSAVAEATVITDRPLLIVNPSPARTHSTASLTLPHAGHARVAIYDALGREVSVLLDGPAQPTQALPLDVSGLAPGIYIVRAIAARTALTRTLVVTR